ncbi:MAG TPA: hypothetical protein VEV17_22045 [Bryobacteraceae bacterium]|nr:hypothetical protein [Bryobacteraceae bacterium]
MLHVSPATADGSAVCRPMVIGLFIASCLLAIVSWYTTQQGMALYLSSWFALLASLGVQSALVLVAWLIGFTKTRRALLIAVYAITAVVSIAFSYVSLYTWFSAQARPATVERKLYDALNDAAGRTESTLAAGIAEGQKHALALEEMTAAEKSHGYISRAQDADPYLARTREAVAREAQTYNPAYREGSGAGLRYTAFDRYLKLTQQSVADMQGAQRRMADFVAELKPLEASDQQLRSFRGVYDSIPWNEVEQALDSGRFERPAVPAYADFVDRSATSQEDLLLAFRELVTAPNARNVFALALAAFIDIIVFLLAYASGPYFFGSAEQRWIAAGAALDASDGQVFARDLLSKLAATPRGMARVEDAALTPGEKQFCLRLAAKGLAAPVEEDGKIVYLLDAEIHERLMDSLATQRMPLRAAAQRMAMGA